MRFSLILTLIALAAAAAIPTNAGAASVTGKSDGGISFWPGSAEVNALAVSELRSGDVRFVDRGAPVVAKGTCVQLAHNKARCPRPSERITVRLGSGDDVVRVKGALAALLRGGPGDDVIEGGSAGDTVRGGPGSDDVRGHDGDDTLRGGAGDDVLRGGADDDRLVGGGGGDSLHGRLGDDNGRGAEGDDVIRGGPGTDRLRGGGGTDRMLGGSGDDRLKGGPGDDLVSGRAGNDEVTGSLGDDELQGQRGNDVLSGKTGDDSLKGGGDDDILRGGSGEDRLDGRRGNDLIVSLESGAPAQAEPDNVVCSTGIDTVRPEQRDTLSDCEFVLLWNDVLTMGAQPRLDGSSAIFSLACDRAGGCAGTIVLTDDQGALGEADFSLAERPDGGPGVEVPVPLGAAARERVRAGTLTEVYIRPSGYLEVGPGGFGYQTFIRGG